MFGIIFCGNKNLKRILTDYGFKGHPLKKNFSLTGEYNINFNYNINAISMDYDSLSQEFRLLTTQNLVGISKIQYNYITNQQNFIIKKNIKRTEVFNDGILPFFFNGIINKNIYFQINNFITSNFYKKLGQFVAIYPSAKKKYK